MAAAISPEALEESLAGLLAAGQAAWPEIAIEPATFLKFLGRQLPPEIITPTGLASLRAGDLYLVCALGIGHPAALAAFEVVLVCTRECHGLRGVLRSAGELTVVDLDERANAQEVDLSMLTGQDVAAVALDVAQAQAAQRGVREDEVQSGAVIVAPRRDPQLVFEAHPKQRAEEAELRLIRADKDLLHAQTEQQLCQDRPLLLVEGRSSLGEPRPAPQEPDPQAPGHDPKGRLALFGLGP